MTTEQKDGALQDIKVPDQPTNQTGQDASQSTGEVIPVKPPDEKIVRSSLAGDASFNLEDVSIEGIPTEPGTSGAPLAQKKESIEEAKVGLNYEPLWNRIKVDYEKQFGDGTFTIPEDVNRENEYEVLLDFFQKSLQPDLSQLPVEAQEIIELHQSGQYDPDQYFEQRSTKNDILKLSDKDLLFEIYRAKNGKSESNPDGFSDSDITEFLSGKSRIELHEMADVTRTQIKQLRTQAETERNTRAQQIRDKEIELIQKKQDDLAKKIVNQFQSNRDFFGIEFTPEDKAQYDKDFMEMVRVNKQTGTHKIAELLNDDAILYKVGAILWKGEGLRGYINDIKESVKKETERKLDPKLEEQRGSTKIAKPVDRGKLV